jgi:hypothetical protein
MTAAVIQVDWAEFSSRVGVKVQGEFATRMDRINELAVACTKDEARVQLNTQRADARDGEKCERMLRTQDNNSERLRGSLWKATKAR